MMISGWLGDDDSHDIIKGREPEVPAIKVGILEKQSFCVEKLEKGREADVSYCLLGVGQNPTIHLSRGVNIHLPAGVTEG